MRSYKEIDPEYNPFDCMEDFDPMPYTPTATPLIDIRWVPCRTVDESQSYLTCFCKMPKPAIYWGLPDDDDAVIRDVRPRMFGLWAYTHYAHIIKNLGVPGAAIVKPEDGFSTFKIAKACSFEQLKSEGYTPTDNELELPTNSVPIKIPDECPVCGALRAKEQENKLLLNCNCRYMPPEYFSDIVTFFSSIGLDWGYYGIQTYADYFKIYTLVDFVGAAMPAIREILNTIQPEMLIRGFERPGLFFTEYQFDTISRLTKAVGTMEAWYKEEELLLATKTVEEMETVGIWCDILKECDAHHVFNALNILPSGKKGFHIF